MIYAIRPAIADICSRDALHSFSIMAQPLYCKLVLVKAYICIPNRQIDISLSLLGLVRVVSRRVCLCMCSSVCVSATLMLNISETKRFRSLFLIGPCRKVPMGCRLVTSLMMSRDSMTPYS